MSTSVPPVPDNKQEPLKPAPELSRQEAGAAAAEKTTWLTDARKALITQILALLVAPLTVALTLYLTDYYRRAAPRIEYSSVTLGHIDKEPHAIDELITGQSRLSLMYQDELSKMTDSKGKSFSWCADWLRKKPWDSDCLEPYADATARIQSEVANIIQNAKNRGSLPSQFEGLLPNAKEAQADLEVVKKVSAGLAEVENTPAERGGSVEITLGVLNAGDSDGTIFKDGTLKFENHVIQISTSDYVVLKAHNFTEVSFDTPWFEGEDIRGTYRVGDEDTIKLLSQEIRTNKAVPFTIEITVSDKT